MNPVPPSAGALAAAKALFPQGRSLHYRLTPEEKADLLLADQQSAAQVIDAHTRADLLALMRKVEADHFRTVTDTGANSHALTVWNALRGYAGLPSIGMDDLPRPSPRHYVMPADSKLLTNVNGGGIV